MKVLVTGASGFVGRATVARLRSNGDVAVRAASRTTPCRDSGARVEHVVSPSLDSAADWHAVLDGCDTVVHAAARVHVMREVVADPLVEFRRVNVDGTIRLAQQAAEIGVRRFVYLSSVKVNGDATETGAPFTAGSAAGPSDAYGLSKLEAELALHEISARTGLEVTIVRPVLVYGPGVGGNFRSMLNAIRLGIPLPFASAENRRSLVAIDNLTSLIETLITHRDAAGRMFLVSDNDDMSTPELLRRTAIALNTTARLLPIPPRALRACAEMIGRRDMAARLLDSLQVDISATMATLRWNPPVSVDEALKRTALDFLARRTP